MAESENWQFNKSALECHKYMFEHSIATDVTFVVSNKVYGTYGGQIMGECQKAETFKAHRYQLICRSPVFHAMLCGDLAEKGDITVDDIDPQAFKQMLNYIYTDEAEMKPELVTLIRYASEKYLLPGLTKLCAEFLEKKLVAGNACILYDHSLLFDETNLTERSLSVFKNQTQKCLKVPSLKYIRQSTMSKMLDCGRLAASEMEVYSACKTWAEFQVKQAGHEVTGDAMRMVLGDCVHKIRYGTMKFEDFGKFVAPAGILLADEEIAVFRFLASKDETLLPKKLKSESRFLKGPFTISHDGSHKEISTASCTTTFEIKCDQTISVKCFHIGEMKEGILGGNYYGINFNLASTGVCLDGNAFKVKSFIAGNPSKLNLEKDVMFFKDIKRVLKISFKASHTTECPVIRLPTLKCATSRELNLVDNKTGLNISVSVGNNMFLLGLTYD